MTIYNALITMSAEPGPRTLGLTVDNVDLCVQANDEMRRASFGRRGYKSPLKLSYPFQLEAYLSIFLIFFGYEYPSQLIYIICF